ncbi:MAG: putative metal-binding motif-containing protein [Myxococcota bacterium]
MHEMHLRLGRAALLLAWGVACVLGRPAPAAAFETNVLRLPRTATLANSAGTVRPCITCHDNADGGTGCVSGGGSAPCLNPFGIDFRGNRLFWDASLASMDSDGDGFTNGQELQDPTGGWRSGDPAPGVDACVTRPGFASFTPGDDDPDMDGFCCFGEDLDGSGDCTATGENNGELDCDETRDTVNSGATELCSNAIDDDCNGLATLEDPVCAGVVDRDGDGYCLMGIDLNGDADCIDAGEVTSDVDCDDTRVTVSPGAGENCFDGIDNDCDELGDMEDPDCRNDVDNDMDGFCPIGTDVNGDGDCLDGAEEFLEGFDCDDREPLANSAGTEVCTDGIDNDCDGNADFRDDECAGFFDGDADGFCPLGTDLDGNGDCIGEGEDVGPGDCNDMDPVVRPSAIEVCNDAIDTDCDGLISLEDPDCASFLDTDGDRYCLQGETGGEGGFDRNRDGDCVDRNEEGGTGDCDDADPDISPIAAEVCIDGVDNDCDGSIDAGDDVCRMDYFDIDNDGWCIVGQDLNDDQDCSDEGEQEGPADTAFDDPTVYPFAPENCTDGKDNDLDGTADNADQCIRDVDADGDGWCPIGNDVNGDGDCLDLDAGENSAEGDCNDGDADINPRIVEDCFNGRDDNCDGDVDIFDVECFRLLDRDGDGFCGTGVDDNRDGDCLDFGEDRFGEDCDDLEASTNPRGIEDCADGVDNDCDGSIDFLDTMCDCASLCDDGDPCTIDDCSGPDTCTNVPDPACGMDGMPVDMGPGGDAGSGGGGDGGGGGCAAAGGATAPVVSLLMVLFARRRREGER